jgi:hemerythrin superfamily protein
MASRRMTNSRSLVQSALNILKADHQKVSEALTRFERIKGRASAAEKQDLVDMVCTELTIHATVEEEIFYPAVRRAPEARSLVDEASVEHASIKRLVGELENMAPEDDLYDAKFKVLGEYVRHHVKEEESEIFPKARKAEIDLRAMGERILERKRELRGDDGAPAIPALRRPASPSTGRRQSTAR